MATLTHRHNTGLVNAEPHASAMLLVARIALAQPMIYHGAGILFGIGVGPGLHAFAAGTHLPYAVAALVGWGEFLGGLGVLSGVLTRLAAAAIAVIMAGAIALVHWPHGFSVTNGGYEYPLTLLIIALALVITGAGKYAVAEWLKTRTDDTDDVHKA